MSARVGAGVWAGPAAVAVSPCGCFAAPAHPAQPHARAASEAAASACQTASRLEDRWAAGRRWARASRRANPGRPAGPLACPAEVVLLARGARAARDWEYSTSRRASSWRHAEQDARQRSEPAAEVRHALSLRPALRGILRCASDVPALQVLTRCTSTLRPVSMSDAHGSPLSIHRGIAFVNGRCYATVAAG